MNPLEKNHLSNWFNVCSTTIARFPHDLSMRQWVILMHIYLHECEHNVKSISNLFELPKPSVSRALVSLSKYGLIKKKRCQSDGRKFLIQKTMKGIAFMNQFNDILISSHYDFIQKQGRS